MMIKQIRSWGILIGIAVMMIGTLVSLVLMNVRHWWNETKLVPQISESTGSFIWDEMEPLGGALIFHAPTLYDAHWNQSTVVGADEKVEVCVYNREGIDGASWAWSKRGSFDNPPPFLSVRDFSFFMTHEPNVRSIGLGSYTKFSEDHWCIKTAPPDKDMTMLLIVGSTRFRHFMMEIDPATLP